MSQKSSITGESSILEMRPHIIDPLAKQMLGAGGSQRLETVEVGGYPQQVFAGARSARARIFRGGADSIVAPCRQL